MTASPDADTRIDRITRLVALLLDHSDEIAAALTEDYGSRPRELSLAADVAGCMIDLTHQRRGVKEWMGETKYAKVQGAPGYKQSVRHDPLGVVGIMGPWNFPLQLTIVPAGSAFAAGNRVLMRPSSITAKTTDVLAKYAPDYFSIEELAIVTSKHGSGSDFAKLKVDHMFFTGSPEVGASVAQEAAKNLIPVTLELGGKNPAVVDLDADIDKAANMLADARLVNGGQVCLCPRLRLRPGGQARRVHRQGGRALDRALPDDLRQRPVHRDDQPEELRPHRGPHRRRRRARRHQAPGHPPAVSRCRTPSVARSRRRS